MMTKFKVTPISKPKKMSSYWLKEWKSILCVILFGIGFNMSVPLIAILQGHLVDLVATQAPNQEFMSTIVIFVVIVLVIQGMRAIKRYSVRLFANKTCATMRFMIYHKIMSLPYIDSENENNADFMNKAVGDIELCVEGMRKVTTEVFDTGVLMFAYFLTMLSYDVKLTLISCIFIPLALLLAEGLKKTVVKYTKATRMQSSCVASLTYETLDHALLYRIYGLEEHQEESYKKELLNLEKKSIRSNVLENSMQSIYTALSMLGIASIFMMGSQLVIQDIWSVGTLSAYITIFTALSLKASKAGKLFNSFQMASVSWHRVQPYFDEVEAFSERLDSTPISLKLQVQDLSFKFHEDLIFKHLSFEAKSGEIIGVCGPIACGKSTLGNALLGIYPYLGSILLNNKELSNYTKQERSQLISYLGHDFQLLSDTIYHNITLGVEGDITQVLKDVCFDEDLKTLKDGIHTYIGSSGVTLSGGQQARIALARTLYHSSSLMILDDPCSGVDQATEALMIENLKTRYHDRLILFISHRLTHFHTFDKVLFLDETPRFEAPIELLENSKNYQALLAMQGAFSHES